jgi:hypothetical protein
MVVDFPDSPSVDDEFTHPQTGTVYVWTGSVWNLKYSASGAAPVPDATDSQKGIIQIATTADVNSGTNTTKAVTPKQLMDTVQAVQGISDATTTVKGIVELAQISDLNPNSSTVPVGNENDVVTVEGLYNRTITATETDRGLVQVATAQEVTDGVSTGTVTKVITPELLLERVADTANIGLVKLADPTDVNVNSNTATGGTENDVVTIEGLLSRNATDSKVGLVQLATYQDAVDAISTDKALTPMTASIYKTTTGLINLWLNDSIPNGWIKLDGTEIDRTIYSNLFTVLVLDNGYVSNTGVFSWNATDTFTEVGHALVEGMLLRFKATGNVPGGFTAETDYYIKVIDADTFKLCTDVALTLPITATDTNTAADFEVSKYGLGDGSTTFKIPNFANLQDASYIIKT